MSLQFHCDHCQRQLNAPEKLAGRQARCPGCKNLVSIPAAPAVEPFEPDPVSLPQEAVASSPFSEETDPLPASSASSDAMSFDDDLPRLAPISQSAPQPVPFSFPAPRSSAPAEPASNPPQRFSPRVAADDSLTAVRDQLHWLFLLALLPLAISILLPDKPLKDRVIEALSDPEINAKMQAQGEGADPFSVFPNQKLPGAHLSRNSIVHWGYAVCSALFFGICLLAMLPSATSSPLAIGGIGLATGTIGILVLLGFQFVAAVTQEVWLTRGHWALLIIFYIVKFIGFSYRCAMEADNGFLLSFFGFTFGVGLCEELVKAAPVIIYCRETPKADWRAVCLVGLASGIGFGVSEGITYSGDYYNGIQPGLTYMVRFLSCVGLHAIWSGTVALLAYSNRQVTDSPITLETVIQWIGYFLIVPMILHGLYDTLLKQDMSIAALGVAAVSFAWFAYLVRERQAEYGFATA